MIPMRLHHPTYAIACYQDDDGGSSCGGGPRPKDCSWATGWKQLVACLASP